FEQHLRQRRLRQLLQPLRAPPALELLAQILHDDHKAEVARDQLEKLLARMLLRRQCGRKEDTEKECDKRAARGEHGHCLTSNVESPRRKKSIARRAERATG